MATLEDSAKDGAVGSGGAASEPSVAGEVGRRGSEAAETGTASRGQQSTP